MLPISIYLAASILSIGATEHDSSVNRNDPKIKVYAIHFPQFHPDRVNDKLWGNGFTEWDNLQASIKLNKRNNSIALPTELGYYNLLEYDIRKKQRELAREYGIDGFIYHHYWFHHQGEGATLAGALEQMLNDGEPDLPFAFNWAKESWVTTWNARQQNTTVIKPKNDAVLWQQEMPRRQSKKIIQHYNYLKKFFHHRNYIKVAGAPLFSVYGNDVTQSRSLDIIERLKELAMEDGFPAPGLHVPLLVMARNSAVYQRFTTQKEINGFRKRHSNSPYSDYPFQHPPGRIGQVFDSINLYPFASAPNKLMHIPAKCVGKSPSEIASLFKNSSISSIFAAPSSVSTPAATPAAATTTAASAASAASAAAASADASTAADNEHGFSVGVLSSFDNTPRRHAQQARIFDRTFNPSRSPALTFENDVVTVLVTTACCQTQESRRHGGDYITINAWNEWGEGMVLEPSTVYGRTLLEAVRKGKRIAAKIGCDWEKYHSYMNITNDSSMLETMR